jgi:hypothetical protein
MIYSKQDNPKCTLCIYATIDKTSANVSCELKGTVPSDFLCRKFKYDIFKKTIRTKKRLSNGSFSKEDFAL